MKQQETEQERREEKALYEAKKMLDREEEALFAAKELLDNAMNDPGDRLGVKAVVSERKALEALKRQEYDKLVNKEYMKTLDKDFNEALEEMWENRY